MSYRLLYPWFLTAVLLVPLIWWAWLSRRRRVSIRFSDVGRLKDARAAWRTKLRHALPVLRTLAVLLLVLSVARPQRADEQTRIQTEGIAIQLVLDRSGSMDQPDFRDERGRPQSRLEAVKKVVDGFVRGDGESLQGRMGDLMGLIAFAHYADTECPLTRDHEHLTRALAKIEIPRTRDEDGTAIGDAVMLGIERIRNIGRSRGEDDTFKVKSRVIILLTDGEQNRGEFLPVEAAEVAASMGVRIYVIGAAPEYAEQTVGGFLFEPQKVRVPIEIDDATLKKVAEKTGGKYFRATDQGTLRSIYEEIDRMERTVVDEQRYEVYEELPTNWIRLGFITLPPPLMMALGLLGLEIVLANTRLRKIP
jgi:Ca-activated chloride channel family protein